MGELNGTRHGCKNFPLKRLILNTLSVFVQLSFYAEINCVCIRHATLLTDNRLNETLHATKF